MSDPIKNIDRERVPKVAKVKVVRVRSGGENGLGESLKHDMILELKEMLSKFPFSVELKWEQIGGEGFDTIIIPESFQPQIEDENGNVVSSGKFVSFNKLEIDFPSAFNTTTVQLGYVSMTEPAPELIIPQANIPYVYEVN